MAVNKYGNNKPVVKEKKVKTEVMFQVDSMEDISQQVQGKEVLRNKTQYGKTYNVYSKDK